MSPQSAREPFIGNTENWTAKIHLTIPAHNLAEDSCSPLACDVGRGKNARGQVCKTVSVKQRTAASYAIVNDWFDLRHQNNLEYNGLKIGHVDVITNVENLN